MCMKTTYIHIYTYIYIYIYIYIAVHIIGLAIPSNFKALNSELLHRKWNPANPPKSHSNFRNLQSATPQAPNLSPKSKGISHRQNAHPRWRSHTINPIKSLVGASEMCLHLGVPITRSILYWHLFWGLLFLTTAIFGSVGKPGIMM